MTTFNKNEMKCFLTKILRRLVQHDHILVKFGRHGYIDQKFTASLKAIMHFTIGEPRAVFCM